jgi:hypothetical protein
LSDKEYKEITKLAETKVKGQPRKMSHSADVLELVKEPKEPIPSYLERGIISSSYFLIAFLNARPAANLGVL